MTHMWKANAGCRNKGRLIAAAALKMFHIGRSCSTPLERLSASQLTQQVVVLDCTVGFVAI